MALLRGAALLSARVQLEPCELNRTRLSAFLALLAEQAFLDQQGPVPWGHLVPAGSRRAGSQQPIETLAAYLEAETHDAVLAPVACCRLFLLLYRWTCARMVG
jgi:hypothetical protein